MTGPGDLQVELEIELCGRLADLLGRALRTTIPSDGCSVEAFLQALSAQAPALAEPIARGHIKVCVNETIAANDMRIAPGDLVALFPPVSGG